MTDRTERLLSRALHVFTVVAIAWMAYGLASTGHWMFALLFHCIVLYAIFAFEFSERRHE